MKSNRECLLTESAIDRIGSPITRSEFGNVLKCLNDNKVTGADNIPAEIIKNIKGSTEIQLRML